MNENRSNDEDASGANRPLYRSEEKNDEEEEISMGIASVFGSITGDNSRNEADVQDDPTHTGSVGLTAGELRRLGDVFGHGFGSSGGSQGTESAGQQGSTQEKQGFVPAKLFDSASSSQNVPTITFTQYSDDSKQGEESPAASGLQEGQRRISFAPSTKPGVVLPVQSKAEADQGGGLFSLIANPMEYIFGGADDEVSEMGGTFFNDASSLLGGESLQAKSLASKLSSLSSSTSSGPLVPLSVAAADKASTLSFKSAHEPILTSISEPIYEVDEEGSSLESSRVSSRVSSRAPSTGLKGTSVQEKTLFSGGASQAAEEKSFLSQSHAATQTVAEDKTVASRTYAPSQVSSSFAPSKTRDDRSTASQSYAPSRAWADKSVTSQSFATPLIRGSSKAVGSQSSFAPTIRGTESVARSQNPGSVMSPGLKPADPASKSRTETGSVYSMGSFAKKDSSDSSYSKMTSANTEISSQYVGDSFGSSSHSGGESVYQRSTRDGYDAETQRQGSSFRNADEETLYESRSEFGGFHASQSFAGETTGSDGYTYDHRSEHLLSRHPSAAAMSSRSLASAATEVFQLHPDGPIMTRSPSGRAVVHVALRSDREGSINKLEYTTPHIDPEPEPLFQDEPDYTTRERSVRSQYRSVMDGDSYSYFPKQNVVPPVSHRKWARIQAMVFLLSLAAAAVTISTFNTLSTNSTSRNTSAAGGGGATLASPTSPDAQTSPNSPTSPSQPTAPVPAYAPTTKTRATIPEPLASNVADWVSASGKIPDITQGIPFYWSFPFGGASVLQYIFGACFGFVQASEVGARWASNNTLGIIQVGGDKYANVDTSTPAGLQHAASMNLVQSKVANIIYSPLLYGAIQTLFTSQDQARLIVTLRHPVEYAVSFFHYLQTTPSDPRYTPALAKMTIEEFAMSAYLSTNIITRALVNKMGGGLTSKDLEQAKLVLRQKAIVGTYDDLASALHRIEAYFGFSTAGKIANCSSAMLQRIVASQAVTPLESGSTAFALIEQRNQQDIQLYNYIRNVLAPHQDQFLSSLASSTSG